MSSPTTKPPSPRSLVTITSEQFDALHTALDARTRRNSTTVKVDRAALVALLRDHGAMLVVLKLGV